MTEREKIIVPDWCTTVGAAIAYLNAKDPHHYYVTENQADNLRRTLQTEPEPTEPRCPCGGEIVDRHIWQTGETYQHCIDCGRLYHGEDQ